MTVPLSLASKPARLMMPSSLFYVPVTIAAALAVPALAHAGPLDACGDIDVRSDAQCEFVAEGCEVECTPLAVEGACAAELHASCEGSCNAEISASCDTSCRASCEVACEVDPGGFDCEAGCRADCGASCEARCDTNDSECWAACEATCGAQCSASCSLTPPQADCVTQCEACCGGSCQAEANLDCQIDCQAGGFAECKLDLQGGCEADCSDAGAALFCDGKWVDVGYDVNACVAQIEDLLNGEVEGQASLQCSGGECSFDSSGLLSCSVDDGRSGGPAALATALLMLGFAGVRRRR